MSNKETALEYLPIEELKSKDIKYFVIGYIDQNNELHFETNCVNSVFMIGMIEHLKVASKKICELQLGNGHAKNR